MSFDSFQASGNSPGCPYRIALPGFGTAGSAVARLIDRTKLSDRKLASILDLADRSKDRSLYEHRKPVGAGLQTGPTFAEAA
jgi:hypothetical protein